MDRAIEKARLLVGAIQVRDRKTSEYLWDLADLSADNTLKNGQHASQNLRSIHDWADEIGWFDQGSALDGLKKMVAEARAWPKDMRDPQRTFWQHAEARNAHKGDIDAARKWLASRKPKANITREARSGILGTGPIYDAILELDSVRRGILRIPAKLASADALGTEPNFDQLRRGVKRVHEALGYLDRYLADETVFDSDELDEALSRILTEEVA